MILGTLAFYVVATAVWFMALDGDPRAFLVVPGLIAVEQVWKLLTYPMRKRTQARDAAWEAAREARRAQAHRRPEHPCGRDGITRAGHY